MLQGDRGFAIERHDVSVGAVAARCREKAEVVVQVFEAYSRDDVHLSGAGRSESEGSEVEDSSHTQ